MSNIEEDKNSMVGKWPYPIAFLKYYLKFAVKARPTLIKLIVDSHRKATNDDEKKLLHQLAIEQFFLLWETLLTFYGAETCEGQIDLWEWLDENFSVLNQKIKMLKEEQLKHMYTSAFPDLEKTQLEDFIDRAVKIAEWMKNLSSVTEVLLSPFNRSKHKFLYYRHYDEVCSLLSEQAERRLLRLKIPQRITEAWKEDMSWLVELANTTKVHIENAIYVIITRLESEGINEWISGHGTNAELFTPQPPN